MEQTLEVVVGGLLLLGSLLMLTGAIGVLRFPDLYTRMHAASVTDTMAALCILLALMLLAGWSLVTAKLLFVLIFLLFTAPVSSHALAKSAYSSGLMPLGKNQSGSDSSTG
ncbi:monovalent cation/H(+) antiporter subunit G [Pseudomaricurvus alcaniphilus]|uniref:monovalent cation/H(+) antiporter subunit G n=1 Tax=Pseudomaricurvus alcaniphilus TaxID=1166482 RepID=UPI00140D958C|nr:monovalent cation/H(+) antiporter subunit G [Pseudomaricurvus alcaniphilus]NHN36490.1 monovalent cation/H(+) antiporter subunit G [Pseudomaricurvus alcaniphilus]